MPGEAPLAFVIRSWQAGSGLPQNTVNAIAQSPDGYLWVGTRDGLARFDGNRFKTFGLNDGLRSMEIRRLLHDGQGALWIGTTGGGLSRLRQGRIETWAQIDGLSGHDVEGLADGPPGTLWLSTPQGLDRWQDGKVECVATLLGASQSAIRTLCGGRSGQVWVPTLTAGLFALEGGKLQDVAVPFPDPRRPNCYFVLEDSLGRIWVSVGNGQLLCRKDGHWRTFTTEEGVPFGAIHCLAEGKDGMIWAGSLGGGVAYFHKERFWTLTTKDGLSDNAVRSLLVDRDGNVWVGTRVGGLNLIRPKSFLTVTSANGLTSDTIRSVAETLDGTLWIGTSGGGLWWGHQRYFHAFEINDPKFGGFSFVESVVRGSDDSVWWGGPGFLLRQKEGMLQEAYSYETCGWLKNDAVQALCDDPHEGLWIGTRRSGVKLLRDRQLVSDAHNCLGWNVSSLALGPDGALWIGTVGDGAHRVRGTDQLQLTTTNGLKSNVIRTIYPDAQGNVWIGTAGGGLSRWEAGSLTHFGPVDGVSDQTVSQILEDDHGYLWLGSNHGITRVRKNALLGYADGRSPVFSASVIDVTDGLPANECSGGSGPGAIRTYSRQLCFSTMRGLVVIDPERQSLEPQPLSTMIEEVQVDGRTLRLDTLPPVIGARSGNDGPANLPQVTIPAGTERVAIEFTAIDLAEPHTCKFKYRLAGLDHDWVESGRRRRAIYTYLPPGQHRFEVLAGRGDLWSDTPAVLSLVCLPQFWQTRIFRMGSTLSMLAAVGVGAKIWSTRQWRKRLERLEQQHALERERARIARDIHDEVGQLLTEINLLSDHGQKHSHQPEQVLSHLRQIGETARLAVQSADSIVWAINPRNDSLPRLADYLVHFAEDFLHLSNIHCRLDVPSDLPHVPLNAAVRHHVLLAVKEALNNVVKHSEATEAWLSVSLESSDLRIVIEDDGRGLPAAKPSQGFGLQNLKEHMTEVGGELEIGAAPAGGTRVVLHVPLPSTQS